MTIKLLEEPKFFHIDMPIFEQNGIRHLSLKAMGEVLYPDTPLNIYKIYRNGENFYSKHATLSMVDSVTGTRETIFLNLKGVILLIMKCNQSKYAEKFQEWAVDHLTNVIETGSSIEPSLAIKDPLFVAEQMNTQISLIIESNKLTIERVSSLEHKNEETQQALRMSDIDRYQRTAIKRRINVIVTCISEEHNLEKRFIYPKVWSWFRDTYNITSYESLPKTLFTDAIETLNSKIIDVEGLIPKDGY